MRDRVSLWIDMATANDPNPNLQQAAGSNEAAEIIDVKGGQVVRGRTIEANINALVTVRASTRTLALTSKDEVRGTSIPYLGVRFKIAAVAVKRSNGRPVWVELDCTRVT